MRRRYLVVFPLLAFGFGHSYPAGARPRVDYSTFVDGNGRDDGFGIAVGRGHLFVVGETFSSDLGTGFTSLDDAYLAILGDKKGNLTTFSYLGGNGGFGDRAKAVVLDSAGNVLVTGVMGSNPSGVSPTKPFGGDDVMDAYVAKFNSSAVRQNFKFFGGERTDEALGIALAQTGDIYVCGWTSSTQFADPVLPVLPGLQHTCLSCDPNNRDAGDAFIARLDASLKMVGWTYLGGPDTKHTIAQGIAVGPSGDVYITGWTEATIPGTTGAPKQADAFIARFSADLQTLKSFSYVGGSAGENGDNRTENPRGIAVDKNENVFITGETHSLDFPTYQVLPGSSFPGPFVYVQDASGRVLFSSSLGNGTADGRGNAIALDSSGDIFVAGEVKGRSLVDVEDFYPFHPPDQLPRDEAFVAKIGPGYQLIFSTYLAGQCADPDPAHPVDQEAFGIALDSLGNVYVTGQTSCGDFPKHNGMPSTLRGNQGVFVTKIIP